MEYQKEGDALIRMFEGEPIVEVIKMFTYTLISTIEEIENPEHKEEVYKVAVNSINDMRNLDERRSNNY